MTGALNVVPFADLSTMPPTHLVSLATTGADRGYGYDVTTQWSPESRVRAAWWRDVCSKASVAIELRMEAAGA